jgi:biotin carboxyl carrier protein
MRDETLRERVRSLAQAFTESGLVRLSLKDGDDEVELTRSARGAAPLGGGSQASAAPSEVPVRPIEAVVSESVGIVRFLRPPVQEGLAFEDDRELAIIETLGIRNAVRSRGPGRVVSVLVSDGQTVEYGQPLFSVER